MAAADNHNSPPTPGLDDVMLAMDVVDTLRYHQTVVERELGAAEYDEALAAKVRKIYADQGLNVSAEVIAEAVAALREERFAYQPAKKGFAAFLARLYVGRGRWFKTFAAAAVILVGLILLYQWFWVRPVRQAQVQQAQRLEQAWAAFQSSQPDPDLSRLGARLHDQGQTALTKGDKQRFEERVSALEGLVSLPGQLTGLMERISAATKDNSALQKAQTLHRDALQSLRAGDLRTAGQAAQTLGQMENLLNQAYTLRIVSRPGMPSGVWRIPPNNPSGRNYYLIVEALDSEGRPLTLPVTSEEDQQTRSVNIWGLRVAPETFEQVRRDKSDDGIIQNNRLGVKRRGYLAPEYLIPTTGGAITQWE